MAKWLTGMTEWRMEWRNGGMDGTATGMADQNGGMADGMVEWSNGRKGGMVEWQKEWQNGKVAEMDTYILFMVHTNTNDDTDDNDTLIFYIKD